MATTYLKRFYAEDAKLRERALIELVHAFETGRMVAFVGSMATEALGYGSWDDLVSSFIGKALALARISDNSRREARRREAAIRALAIIKRAGPRTNFLDRLVALSAARELVTFLDEIDPLRRTCRIERLERAIARNFKRRNNVLKAGHQNLLRGLGVDPATVPSAINALIDDLRIRRFATLNYDLELESALMVEPGDIPPGVVPDEAPGLDLAELQRRGVISRDESVPNRLSRLLLNGLAVESDVRSRERPDRLIDFAAGSVEVDYQIMHLHGAAHEPKTMIIGRRDYDLLYRKTEPAKVAFEHGQRILFAGNPVLFVGAGMGEPEVNSTLQDFVSNNPYRRFAPAFLLWGTSGFAKDPEERRRQMWLKRIDFFRRLGVLTIFDEDLRPDSEIVPKAWFQKDGLVAPPVAHPATVAPSYQSLWQKLDGLLNASRKALARKRSRQARALDLVLLTRSVQLLGRAASIYARALGDWRGEWRSLDRRLQYTPRRRKGEDSADFRRSIALWGTHIDLKTDAKYDFEKLFAPTNDAHGGYLNHRVVVAPSGSGKGCLAWAIAEQDDLPGGFHAPAGRRLIINAGFALDTDFILMAISRFLHAMRISEGRPPERAATQSRERQFEDPAAFKVGSREALIVINGLERFFAVSGAPLSAELDHLLRRVMQDREGNVRWVFLGSSRVERYFRFLCAPAVFSLDQVSKRKPSTSIKASRIKSVYFDAVVQRIEQLAADNKRQSASFGDLVVLDAKKRSQPRPVSRSVLGAYLSARVLERVGFGDAHLGMEILRAMAFVGTPIEAVVLLHVPRIRNILLDESSVPDAKRLLDVLKRLELLALVIRITPFEAYPGNGKGLWQRFGLHTAITSELRYQFGVPLSESKLSTSFNMSLFVAQPVDGFVPEAGIHDELGDLIDHLIGSYKDKAHPSEKAPLDRAIRRAGRSSTLSVRCAPHAVASLRAALAVVRSYYSTTSLLTIDRADRRASEDRDGVLLEHAERLETILNVYRKLRRARDEFRPDPHSDPDPDLGPEPFYPDDLVWILNELGVIYLAQGDLYSARRSLDQALAVNSAEVEYSSHSHNWRRITINEALLRIERGDLTGAEAVLRDVETSINVRSSDTRDANCARFDFIRVYFGDLAPADRSCFDKSIMYEEILMTGLVLGHRALCQHLRGNLETADPLYKQAIAILRRLGENRAYAFFQRHYAQLYALLEPSKGSSVPLRLALAAAESVRQMDMAYHARINEAEAAWRREGSDIRKRRDAVRHLSDAVAYGALMDLHRLRIEASIHLAGLKLDSGDYESALDHATEAMALAARYGMTLRKINLRLLIGHILIRRGDRKSGLALIERAAEAADRFGYQRAVEQAQKIKVEEEVVI
ncbi:MAG: hypothetical protein QOE79_2639 [Sphingomonadales bacterium]|jgi:tetratricopeptide (TPR) repeat protein|nr:hypothetical protein [Sphingomonadales bacterium]MEA3048511.1 hypothetical protein [Sphingomonadales bacterium]